MRTKAVLLIAAAGVALATSAVAADRTVTLKVPGMDCPSCPYIVSKVLKRVAGVKSVKTSYKKRTAIVVFDEDKTGPAALTAATGSVGYNSSVVQ